MDMTKKPASKRVREVTLANVQEVHRKMAELEKEADALVQLMEDKSFGGSVMVDGGKKAMEGIKWLRKWLLAVRAEFQDADLPMFDDPEITPPASARQKKAKR